MLLGFGLALEINRHLRELPDVIGSSGGLIREILLLLLFAALLLHQLGEFHERVPARRERRPGRSKS
jgi:hypothetical protein